MKLLIATRNPHKLDEIREILKVPGLELICLADFPETHEVEEDAETFEGNAVKKAREMAAATGLWTLADDSGLEVDALGGVPGVRSARYAGEPVSYAANNALLLRELRGQGNRRARFRCVVALAVPGECVRTVEGRCEGRIAAAPRGSSGFGYDPLFIPDGHDRTFAEMPAALKNRMSHRAAALAAARVAWGDMFNGER
jgi:XTP/dITP diphosphohydrolase